MSEQYQLVFLSRERPTQDLYQAHALGDESEYLDRTCAQQERMLSARTILSQFFRLLAKCKTQFTEEVHLTLVNQNVELSELLKHKKTIDRAMHRGRNVLVSSRNSGLYSGAESNSFSWVAHKTMITRVPAKHHRHPVATVNASQ